MSVESVTSPVQDRPAAPDLRMLAVSDLIPDDMQPRVDLEGESTASEFRTLQGLAESIAESGVIQPLVVRELPSGGYQIQSGHRRHAAAKLAGQAFVPCIIVKDDGKLDTKRISQIAENAQRKAMTSKELAVAIQELLRLGLSKGDVARRLGIQESRVTLLVRLFALPERLQEAFADGHIVSPRAAYELERLPVELQELLLTEAKRIPLTQATVQEARRKWESSGGVRPPLTQTPALHPTLLAAVVKYLKNDLAHGGEADTYSSTSVQRDRVRVFGEELSQAGPAVEPAHHVGGPEATPYAEEGQVRLPKVSIAQAQALVTVIASLNQVDVPVHLCPPKSVSADELSKWLVPQLLAIRPHS
ncbi:MAG: ParB/RepB/Spo0J family partition protein [Burkholderiaceae bacterium]|nr:ParB/RepB/Spo0J family partition protein [Burkholderiaceae bacterium]